MRRRSRNTSEEKRRGVGAGVDLNEDIHTADHRGDDQEVTAGTDITAEEALGLLTVEKEKEKDIHGGDTLDQGQDHGLEEENEKKRRKTDTAE